MKDLLGHSKQDVLSQYLEVKQQNSQHRHRKSHSARYSSRHQPHMVEQQKDQKKNDHAAHGIHTSIRSEQGIAACLIHGAYRLGDKKRKGKMQQPMEITRPEYRVSLYRKTIVEVLLLRLEQVVEF